MKKDPLRISQYAVIIFVFSILIFTTSPSDARLEREQQEGSEDGQCGGGSAYCGNGFCDSGETCSTCPSECGICCKSGSIPAEFEVTQGGAGTYRIPIDIPPGSAGMQPSLSLVYSSHARNGELGMGWHVEGLSAISRCAANLAQDGYVVGINYDSADRLCLDGRKLIAISGTYGANGTEYRLDPDDFTKIISYGSDGYGAPQYFKVWREDGNILEYGGNVSSSEGRIERVVFTSSTATLKGVRLWAVNQISDHTGKYMSFDYSESNTTSSSTGEYWLDSISYTSMTCGDLSCLKPPYNKITFEYTTRPDNDSIYQYYSGGRMLPTKRISAIKTMKDIDPVTGIGTVVQRYLPTYGSLSPVTNRSRLSTLELCAADSTCLPATSFQWQSEESPAFAQRTGYTTVVGTTTVMLTHAGIMTAQSIAEENKPTEMTAVAGTKSLFGWANRYVSTAKYAFATMGPLKALLFLNGIGGIPVGADTYATTSTSKLVGDINNDGRGDMIVIRKGSAFGLNILADSLTYNTTTKVYDIVKNGTVLSLWHADDIFLFADVTGDGRTDIINIYYDGTNTSAAVYEAQTDLSFALKFTSFLINGPFSSIAFQATNLNGDGKADLIGSIVSTSGSYSRIQYPFISNGSGFTSYPLNLAFDGNSNSFGSFPASTSVKELLMDVNSDGLTDYVFVQPGSTTRIDVFTATPQTATGTAKFKRITPSSGYTVSFTSGISGLQNYYILPMDVNGDGNEDLAMLGNVGGSAMLQVYLSNGEGSTFEKATTTSINVGAWDTCQGRIYPGDFNGDGRADFLVIDQSIPRADIYISQGRETTVGPIYTKYGNQPYYYGDQTASYIIQDVNGDGKDDITSVDDNAVNLPLCGDPAAFPFFTFQSANITPSQAALIQSLTASNMNAYISVYPTTGVFPDLMTKAVDGYGKTTNITYKPITDSSVYDGHTDTVIDSATRSIQSYPYVVSSYNTSNGENPAYQINLNYGGAKYHDSYGFLGFETMHTNDPQKWLEELSSYNQKFPLTGTLNSFLRTVNGGPVYSQTNSWTSWNLGGRYTATLASTHEISQELNFNIVNDLLTTYSYVGNYYHLNQITKQWLLDNRTETTTINYIDVPSPDWLLGLPADMTIVNAAPNQSSLQRFIDFTPNLTTGLLTQKAVTGLGPLPLTTDYTYDTYGNVTEEKISGSNITTQTTKSPYDTYGRFPTYVENPKGQRVTETFEHGFGKPLSSIDANSLVSTWEYDNLGRVTKETSPDTTVSTWKYCENGVTPLFSFYVKKETSDSPYLIQQFDELRRIRKTETNGFDGRKVYTDTNYDARQNLLSQSLPYFTGDPSYLTLYGYDNLDRLASVTEPSGATTSIDYNGRENLSSNVLYTNQVGNSKTVTNGLNQKTKVLSDSLGNILQVQNLDTQNALIGLETYLYNPFNVPTKSADIYNNQLVMGYDSWNRLTSVTDPDSGSSSYGYDVLGNLTNYTGPDGSASMTYDALNRILTSTSPEGTSRWYYDTAIHGVGKLAREEGLNNYSKDFEYDALSRINKIKHTIDTNIYQLSMTYTPTNSRLETLTYPFSWLQTKNVYTALGYLQKVIRASDSFKYWEVTSRNASGQLSAETMGDGQNTAFTYDPLQRTLKGISTGTSGSIQNLTYQYDLLGNVKERKDVAQNVRENFSYDSLNRLLAADISSGSGNYSTDFEYDDIGNLIYKSDIGLLFYGTSAGPHALTATVGPPAVGYSFTYDPAGNLLSDGVRTLTWYSFNKIHTIAKTGRSMTLFYDPDYNKIKQAETGPTLTRYYVDKYFEHESTATNLYKYYIYSDNYPVAIYTYNPNTTVSDTKYLHRDHLASTDTITNSNGTVSEKLSYDAFGQRRNSNWQPATPTSQSIRGFTDHEHLDSTNLIDMESRMYDPRFGRFISPDPIIPDLYNTQHFNRYSYVNNNPITFIDPSGHQADPPGWHSSLPDVVITGERGGGSSWDHDSMNLSFGYNGGQTGGPLPGGSNIKMLTSQRELTEKNRSVSQGILKARRNQESDTLDVAKKTDKSEMAREVKRILQQVKSNIEPEIASQSQWTSSTQAQKILLPFDFISRDLMFSNGYQDFSRSSNKARQLSK